MLSITELFEKDDTVKLKDKCFCYITKDDRYEYSGLIIKVKREYGTGRTDYIEIYTQSNRKQPITNLFKMKVNESFDAMFEAERFYPKNFDEYVKSISPIVKIKKSGIYTGEGIFGYHKRNLDFIFTISFLNGTYGIKSKKGLFSPLYEFTITRLK